MTINPDLPTKWRPSSLAILDQCPARFAMREEGWRKPEEVGAAPHADFGTVFHAVVEEFDHDRFFGVSIEEATDNAIDTVLILTWDFEANRPLWGTVVDEWTCTGLSWNPSHTRRSFACDAARDWWIGSPRLCPKCNRPVENRTQLLNNHPAKNRLSLLRAVLAYCDASEGLGVASVNGQEPGLEVELEFELHWGDDEWPRHLFGGTFTIQTHWDRYSSLGETRFVHERKTTSRYLGRDYWRGYETNLQVATYDLAAHKLGIRCDGVMLEAVQIQAGGVRIARTPITKGPEHRAETEREILSLIADAHRYHAAGHWPRRTAVCNFAAGGKPCEFLDVCAAAPSVREHVLKAGYVKESKDVR